MALGAADSVGDTIAIEVEHSVFKPDFPSPSPEAHPNRDVLRGAGRGTGGIRQKERKPYAMVKQGAKPIRTCL